MSLSCHLLAIHSARPTSALTCNISAYLLGCLNWTDCLLGLETYLYFDCSDSFD